MWCSGLEADRHEDVQWKSSFSLQPAPTYHQTSPSLGKKQEGSLTRTEDWSTYMPLSHVFQGVSLVSPSSLHHRIQQLVKISRKGRKIIIVTGSIISAAWVTGADQLPVLTACGQETSNCVTQKSNEGWSQLVSHQQLRGGRRRDKQIAMAPPEAVADTCVAASPV